MSTHHNEAQMIDPSTGLPVYGMDLEIKKKIMDKKDPKKEQEVRDWIEEITGEKFAKKDDFQASLKDGILLCKLVNKIQPNIVKQISTQKMPFMQMGNISHFLEACKTFGVPKHDLFVVIDLYEGKNIPVVVDTLYSLGSVCKTLKNYNGPLLGVKRSEKKEIQFTDEQLREAKNAPSLFSLGGKGCASQSGDRDTSRDIIKSNIKSVSNETTQWTQGSIGYGGDRDTSRDVIKPTPKIDTNVGKKEEKKSSGDDDLALLEKLASLKESGIITEEEFQFKKKKILGL